MTRAAMNRFAGHIASRSTRKERFTRPSFTATPSPRKRRACSRCCRDDFGNTIRPPAPTTRCHGRLLPCGAMRNANPASRARPGSPAARATAPYVVARPRGIAQITSQIAWIAGLSPTGAGRRGRASRALGGSSDSENALPRRVMSPLLHPIHLASVHDIHGSRQRRKITL